jgi:hypothetical protein
MIAFKFDYTVKNVEQAKKESNSIAFAFSATTKEDLIKEASNMNLSNIEQLSEKETLDLLY